MSIHFHPLTVSDVRTETDECVSIAFQVPDQLKEIFAFKPGQNLTVRLKNGNEEIRRSYSICSAPGDGELRIAVKKIPKGRFSEYANHELRPGHTIDVLPPTGRFTPKNIDAKRPQHYVLIAAGSGITPILSIVKTLLAEAPQTNVTLIYGNKNRMSIIFREELEALKNRHMRRFRLLHILSREHTDLPIQRGRIDEQKCQQLSNSYINWSLVDEVFICGPSAMTMQLKNALPAMGVPNERIHFELFNAPASGVTAVTTNSELSASGANNPVANVRIRVDGIALDLSIPYNGQPILDAALAAGADLPFACKGGVCATCKARLLEGEVEMDNNYALDQQEVEAGFILTCQSHPRSATLSIDFDQR